MSRGRRNKALYVRDERAPILSDRTLARIAALQVRAGEVYTVTIAHEEHCYRALERGARRCVCSPDLTLVPWRG
jgi:hypothetical protein